MRIVIGNAIEVFEPTQAVLNFCRNHLVIDNPDYYKKERMGRWTGNTPRTLHLYEVWGGRVIIPYGCRKRLYAISDGVQSIWDDYDSIENYVADYRSNISLYDYQEEVVNKMNEARNGVVVMPCGSGKTQTALELVARLGLKTLWLTHTQDLLNQSMERAKACFDCDADMFGTITAGKVNIGKGITFATVQTMCKLDLAQYRKQWAVVIVDECQHCCGTPTRMTQFYKVVNSLYAPYKFGLTATPNRSDGLDASMYALLGDIVSEVSKDNVSSKTCTVKIDAVRTGYIPNYDMILNGDGTINYGGLIDDLIYNKDRYDFVVDILNSKCRKYTIVLASRVAYLEMLQKRYAGASVCLSSKSYSQKAKAERKEALRKLNAGEIDCIFATYQLAAEGLDCPNLRYVVFATPEKNERTVTQAVGRVARKADGKEFGTVIDLIDEFGLYQGWAKKRKGYYKKLGCLQ